MTDPQTLRAVEAVLFAAAEPLTPDSIRAYVGELDVRGALAALVGHYEGRGIRLVERGGRWHFETAPDLAHLLRRDREEVRRLSRAGIETLAIIAYHEPVTRAEIEAIRGVQTAKGTLDVLMEAGWIRPAGRREVVEAGEELARGQVAGGAEEHQDVRGQGRGVGVGHASRLPGAGRPDTTRPVVPDVKTPQG